MRIRLNSIIGDADLYASLSDPNPNDMSFDYRSRRTTRLDEIFIEEKGGTPLINRPIYISVVGRSRAFYELDFIYTFEPEASGKLP